MVRGPREASDLLAGVLVGIALAMARLLDNFERMDVRMDEDPATGRTMIHLVIPAVCRGET